ncbi:glycolate oxidase [Desulfitispora alkaliphila]|uniref:FAD-binding oxidoreductase n=1 Tax=Desulfitispora alkaliphila TaxID=622674 RepID=UPI003D21502D
MDQVMLSQLEEIVPDMIVKEDLVSVKPVSTEQVAAVMKWAHQANRTISTRDSDPASHVHLDLSNMGEIEEVDGDNFVAIVQSGINLEVFRSKIKEQEFNFPLIALGDRGLDLERAVSNDITGPTTAKFGKWREFVLGMELVLSTGKVIKVGGKNIKNVSGMDIIGLATGSGGDLGVITKLWLRLLPVPEGKLTMVARFTSMAEASRAASALTEEGLIPNKAEVVSGQIAKEMGFSVQDNEALVLILVEGFKNSLKRQMTAMEMEFVKRGTIGTQLYEKAEEVESLWEKYYLVVEELDRKDKYLLTVLPSRLSQLVSGVEKVLLDSKVKGDFISHGTVAKLNVYVDESKPLVETQIGKIVSSLGGRMDGRKIGVESHINEIEALERGLVHVFNSSSPLSV